MDLHTWIKVRWTDINGKTSIIETTVGRVLFNEVVPNEVGFINEVLTKKALRDIIGRNDEGDRQRREPHCSWTTSRTWAS
jgi:hypothetical protein